MSDNRSDVSDRSDWSRPIKPVRGKYYRECLSTTTTKGTTDGVVSSSSNGQVSPVLAVLAS
jgi:hypothetical protein